MHSQAQLNPIDVSVADNDVRYVPEGDGTMSFGAVAHESRYCWALEQFASANDVVLDFGCGSGYGTNILAEKASSCLGLDISEAGISYARRTFVRPGLQYEVADLADPSVGDRYDRQFDLIVSFDVIEHVQHYFHFAENIAKLLRTSGTALIGCPNRLETFTWNDRWTEFHVQEFTPDQLKWLLSHYFDEVEILGQDFADARVKASAVASMRTSLRARLARYPFIVRAVRLAKKLSGRSFAPAAGLRLADIHFVSEKDDPAKVNAAFGLVAICRKPKPNRSE